jgi:hypothetical protein
MAKRLLRPKQIWGRQGPIPVGRTKFDEDYVHHEGGDEFIPGTNIPRLRLVRLGPRSVAAVEQEVEAVIEQLMAERDAERKSPVRTGDLEKIEQPEPPNKQSKHRHAAAEQGGGDANR